LNVYSGPFEKDEDRLVATGEAQARVEAVAEDPHDPVPWNEAHREEEGEEEAVEWDDHAALDVVADLPAHDPRLTRLCEELLDERTVGG
jgi:hypothetical protein